MFLIRFWFLGLLFLFAQLLDLILFYGFDVFVHLHNLSLILVSWVSEVSWVSDSVYLEVFLLFTLVTLKHLGTECKEQKSDFTDVSTRTANKQVICT